MICLVPARKGSRRIPNKNLRKLGDRPLLCWALRNAFDSEVFDQIVLSTESEEIASTALDYFGKHLTVVMRAQWMAADDSPDIDWVKHALGCLEYRAHSVGDERKDLDPEFSILRPTSPFLGPETIQRAKVQWDDIKGDYAPPCKNCQTDVTVFAASDEGFVCKECGVRAGKKGPPGFTSMRAIRRATETAWKQWRYAEDNHEIDPITSVAAKKHLHSRPTQTLEDTWIQTAGLEMAWTRTPIETGTIAGDRVAGFVVEGSEALDLNTPEDWTRAVLHLHSFDLRESRSVAGNPTPTGVAGLADFDRILREEQAYQDGWNEALAGDNESRRTSESRLTSGNSESSEAGSHA